MRSNWYIASAMNDALLGPVTRTGFDRIGGGAFFCGGNEHQLVLLWAESFLAGIEVFAGALLGVRAHFVPLRNHDAGQRRLADADRAIEG